MAGTAPRKRGWATAMGKALGTDVEGVMTEAARNKANPDTANRTGQPWPDNNEDAVIFLHETGSGTLDGTSDSVSLPFTVPSQGLWQFTVSMSLAGGADVLTGDQARVNLGIATAPGDAGFYSETYGIGIPWPVPDPGTVPVAGGWSFSYPIDTAALDLPAPFDLYVEATTGFASTSNTADWSLVGCGLQVWGIRIATDWTTP